MLLRIDTDSLHPNKTGLTVCASNIPVPQEEIPLCSLQSHRVVRFWHCASRSASTLSAVPLPVRLSLQLFPHLQTL